MAAYFTSDECRVAVGRPFHHVADYRLGEQVLHAFSSTCALFKPCGYLHKQCNRLRTAGPADRIDLRSSTSVTRLLVGPGRQSCRDTVFRALLTKVFFPDAG